MAKTREKRQGKLYYDTNTLTLLGGGGELIRESEIPLQELWLKIGGGLIELQSVVELQQSHEMLFTRTPLHHFNSY